MGFTNTIKETLQASTESANRGGGKGDGSKDAYWCHDCAERVRDVDVKGEEPPDCPDCGAMMEFERSPSTTGCAC
ncbi:zinc-ribbon domain-containing protein [Halococcus dombrowskii]|uniref:Zinc-ribbon domain-containing protein n=1 Tax=Halococcus dombrowskii TaxID=179637 RepID=A0AAV3SFD3_HALDO|nr:zinc-ribbon domain-containing protein [Halococcus dombrowskii]UOO95654.1 zinc-ribbon domain-containing protein [Halococcus dombrowskii]